MFVGAAVNCLYCCDLSDTITLTEGEETHYAVDKLLI